MGGMADRDKGTDIDKLLAEVDGMLSGGGTPAKGAVAPAGSAEPSRGRFVTQVRTAAISGAVAAVGVFIVFLAVPFVLDASSGAVGAFLGTFGAVLIFRRRR
jgi:hypothetical protein